MGCNSPLNCNERGDIACEDYNEDDREKKPQKPAVEDIMASMLHQNKLVATKVLCTWFFLGK